MEEVEKEEEEVLRGESRRNCFLTSAETERFAHASSQWVERKITMGYGFADFTAARYHANIFITYPVNSPPNNPFCLIYGARGTFNVLYIEGKGRRGGWRAGGGRDRQ